jgi:UDP-glucose 4-epimerase
VIIVSSGGTVYGPVASLPITENHQTRPISPYGITKLAIDLYAMMYYRNEGLPVIIVRPSNAYGSDQKIGTGQGFLPAAINAIHTNKEVEIYGEHGTIRDYIHVSDVASGILAALYNGMEGNIYNIGTGVGTSNSEIFDMLKKLAYRDGLKARKRIVQPRRFDVEANILDSSKLEKECGWIPQIKLKDGIIRMWNDALLK